MDSETQWTAAVPEKTVLLGTFILLFLVINDSPPLLLLTPVPPAPVANAKIMGEVKHLCLALGVVWGERCLFVVGGSGVIFETGSLYRTLAILELTT